MSSHPMRPAISRKKAFVFSIIPVSLLLLLLLLVEAGLRLLVPSLGNPLLLETTYDGIQWYQVNRRYLEKYFPARTALVPEFKPTLIRQEQTPGMLRVLCLGESSMFGTPYQMTATIPGILRKQLRHALPDREVEVINLGAAAINTNAIRDFAPQLLVLRPDVVVIYTGHNEFYGPEGVGASFLEKKLPFLTPLKYAVRDLRLAMLLQRMVSALTGSREPEGEQNMMRQVSNNTQVQLGSGEAERVLSRFTENLRAAIALFRDNGIRVLVSDVASNLLFPPFAYEERAGFDAISEAGGAGDYRTVARLLGEPYAADTLNAFLQYWRGRAALAAADSLGARRFLESARDRDLLKFRAPGAISEIIHRVCSEQSVPCLRMDSLLSALSPLGITDTTLFWEHLHLKAKGYYHIATAFFRELCAQGLLPTPVPAAAYAHRLPWQVDSLGICWLDRAYAELSIRGLTGRWPFRDYRVITSVLDRADHTLRQIVADVYMKKTGWTEGCLATALRFEALGNLREARTTYEAMLDDYPRAFHVHYLLGNLLKRTGELAAARDAYERSIRYNPAYAYPRVDLGLLLINEGRLDEAAAHLTRAIDLAGNDPATVPLRSSAYYGLSAIAANRGDYALALRQVDQSLRILPTYAAARALRQQLRARQQQAR